MARFSSDSRLVKTTLLLISALTTMAAAIVAPALPAMQADFAHIEDASALIRLVLTLPALLVAIGAPLTGWIDDRFGKKLCLVISIALYGVAGVSAYWLSSLTAILVTRALLGVGAAGIMTSVTSLIADYYSGPQRAKLLGMQAAYMGFGATVFTFTGGALADAGWRYPFLLYLIAPVMLPLAIYALFEPKRDAEAPSQPGPPPALAIAMPDECVAEAQRCDLPIVPPRALPTQRLIAIVALIYATVLLLHATFYVAVVNIPFYLLGFSGDNGLLSGLAIAVITFFYAAGSLLSPNVARLIRRGSLAALAFALIGLGYGVIGLTGMFVMILLGLTVGGVGFGFLLPTLNVWLTDTVSVAVRGRALGGLTMFTYLGKFISPLLTEPLLGQMSLGAIFLLVGGLLIVLGGVVWLAVHFSPARRAAPASGNP